MQIVGVRFRRAGKIHEYLGNGQEMARNRRVIAEATWGNEIGTVVYVKEVESLPEDKAGLKPVIRLATAEDLEKEGRNREKEANAYKICEEKIAKHGLAMKLVAVEYTFDNNKILFYFTADNRVDFRELVKDLASVFHTRIELRQIGVRDETKILGGVGVCGRILCCHSYLSEFQPVSIRMAKEQNLSLNPSKISGICGRLMCCLNNEQATYEYLNSRLPGLGDTVTIRKDGTRGTVQSVNVLRQTVKVLVNAGDDDTDVRDCAVEDLSFNPRHRKGKMKLSAEEMKEMKDLQVLEQKEKHAEGSKLE
jgi:cell fate regulator YaaT (PSP1 superfamily)